jgi:YVTN family beta-propeller protein
MRTLLTLAVLATLSCGRSGERVYVSDEDGGNVVVIDAATAQVVANVQVGKRPRGLRVSPDGSRLFVALSGSPKAAARDAPSDRSADGIGVIDLASLKLVRVIHAGQDPEAFDVTGDGRRLWVSNEETAEASLVDVDTGEVLRRAPVGAEPEGVAIDPAGRLVYVTNEADGTVSVLDVDSGRPVAQLPACGRPRAVAFSADGLRAFVSCETVHALAVLDTRGRARSGEITLSDGARPMGLAVAPDGRALYASSGRGRGVEVVALDAPAPRVARTISDVGARPWGLGLTRDGKRLYTANGPSGDVSVIDTERGAVIARVHVGGSPWGIAVR